MSLDSWHLLTRCRIKSGLQCGHACGCQAQHTLLNVDSKSVYFLPLDFIEIKLAELQIDSLTPPYQGVIVYLVPNSLSLGLLSI